ncbi:MAG: M1 family metallopeptidase [Phycisphaerales bacterium JB054]
MARRQGAWSRSLVKLAVLVSGAVLGLVGPAVAQDGDAGADERPEPTRSSPAGPTFDSAFRAPTGFQGTHIFAPLDWPQANRVRLGSGAPGVDYWQQKVDYSIDATLHAEERAVSGRATVTYHNNSPDTLSYVWLHLEQNLFREDSVGALSKEPGSRFGYREGFEGGYAITSLTSDGRDLEMAVYDTLGRIDLDDPIEPGETFTFQIAWSFNIPPFGADRLAVEDVEQGAVFELAQWFPAVVMYDDIDGWNTLGYLGQGEFYTNFGDYDVRITAPRSHVVVSSGLLQNASDVLTDEAKARYERARRSTETVTIRSAEEVGDPASWPAGEEPLTWAFEAKNVRTFAWASSDAFIWDGANLEISDRGTMHDGNVFVQAAYPKEGIEHWQNAVAMAQHSIGFNSAQWHPYPYAVAVNVNGRVGGMEYPGIVFCRARRSERSLYGVTDHEFGHNWFPMMVNTDERRYAWMDEGFNTFLNIYTKADYFDETDENGRGTPGRMVSSQSRDNQQPIMSYPDQIWRGRLGYLAYGKPAAALWQLRENVLGPERFDRAFREYIDRWAFKHPQPADFFRTMEDVAGADLAWFWRGWFYSTSELDQAVVAVEENEDGDWVYVDLENRRDMVMPVELEVEYDDGSTDFRRLPVEIWATTNAWTAGWNPKGRRVVRVTLDPNGMLPDFDESNDEWVAE